MSGNGKHTDPNELAYNARQIGDMIKDTCPKDVEFLFLFFHKSADGAVAFSTNARREHLRRILEDFTDRLSRTDLNAHTPS